MIYSWGKRNSVYKALSDEEKFGINITYAPYQHSSVQAGSNSIYTGSSAATSSPGYACDCSAWCTWVLVEAGILKASKLTSGSPLTSIAFSDASNINSLLNSGIKAEVLDESRKSEWVAGNIQWRSGHVNVKAGSNSGFDFGNTRSYTQSGDSWEWGIITSGSNYKKAMRFYKEGDTASETTT